MEQVRPKFFRINSDRCLLDNLNPRLPAGIAGKNQKTILEHMKESYDLEEIALSMVANGYFEAEPLVAIPLKDIDSNGNLENYVSEPESEFIVVEGNRRLATIRGLQKRKFKDIEITASLMKQIEELPILVYPNRKGVLNFLGVHHLAGVRRWDAYERARYIVQLKKEGSSIEEIQKIIGDRRNSAKKTYICYRLIEIIQNYDETFNIEDAIDNFSFLQLATGQGAIKNFIGLKSWQALDDIENPIPDNKLPNLKLLFECLFDNGNTKKFIKESRDITSKLSKILSDEPGTQALIDTRNIDMAFEIIGGESIAIEKFSNDIKRKMEFIVGKLSGMDMQKASNNENYQKFKSNFDTIVRLTEDIKKRL